jgi:hypothetical protein
MKRPLLLSSLAALLLLTSCNTQWEGAEKGEANLVSVDLAVCVGTAVATKGDPSVITEMSQRFRGMTDVTLLSFDVRRDIEGSDVSIFHPSYLPDISEDLDTVALSGEIYAKGLLENNHAHLYPSSEVNIMGGTSALLAYGHPPQTDAETLVEKLHLNGALTANGLGEQPTLRSASDISFSPVKIYDGRFPAEAGRIATVLNRIVAQASHTASYYYFVANEPKTGSVSVTWDETIDDDALQRYFKWITNDGNLISECGFNIETMITYIYRRLKDYTNTDSDPVEHLAVSGIYDAYKDITGTTPLTYGDLYRDLRDTLVNRIEGLVADGVLAIGEERSIHFTNPSLTSYPTQYGIPDGIAVIRWHGISYSPASDILDGVASMSSFCYPPELWYYANSTISTASSDRTDEYSSSRNPRWTDILGTYRTGKVIRGDTESVALDKPMQYSCAMLVASVRATSVNLDDADGDAYTYITLNGTNMPVTGVIIGSQRELNFDFTPKENATDYCMYDNCITGINLMRAANDDVAPMFRSLVSQTPDGDPVYFCLELRNDTGRSFTGADGIVLPGSKFYMLGLIELPDDNSFAQAFQQDYTTRIHCTIPSLAQAHICIPDLSQPNLDLGLQININWTESTPSYLILY